MAYIEFKGLVKKVNLKPKGVTEIVLELPTRDLGQNVQDLSEMIDKEVETQLESEVIQFNVQFNASTNRPLKNYTVDQTGIVNVTGPEPNNSRQISGFLKKSQWKLREKLLILSSLKAWLQLLRDSLKPLQKSRSTALKENPIESLLMS